MKRPILFSIFVAIIAFCYCFWGLAPKEAKLAKVSVVEPAAKPIVAGASLPTEPAAPVSQATESRVPESLSDARKRIMDSPDLLATISNIRKSGTQDEKDWALTIRALCLNVRGAQRAADASSAVVPIPSPTPDERRLAGERQSALEALSRRCKGIWDLSPEESAALKSDLIAGSDSNSSRLGRLHALVLSQDNRWTDEQASIVTSALYSGDPILVRDALFAIQGAIDIDAPGGADRNRALELAFSKEIVLGQQSDFESLTSCYLAKLCQSNAEQSGDQSSLTANTLRLEREYKSALEAHEPVRRILAIH